MDIFEAARTNNTEALKVELTKVGTFITDNRGSSPLIIAAYYNHLEATQVLLDAHANLEFKDATGNTALMGASFKGYKAVAEMLLRHGSLPNAVNGNGATALSFAATFGHLAIIELLLTYGADPLLKDHFGKNPIDYAMVQENDACYEALVAAIHQPNETTKN